MLKLYTCSECIWLLCAQTVRTIQWNLWLTWNYRFKYEWNESRNNPSQIDWKTKFICGIRKVNPVSWWVTKSLRCRMYNASSADKITCHSLTLNVFVNEFLMWNIKRTSDVLAQLQTDRTNTIRDRMWTESFDLSNIYGITANSNSSNFQPSEMFHVVWCLSKWFVWFRANCTINSRQVDNSPNGFKSKYDLRNPRWTEKKKRICWATKCLLNFFLIFFRNGMAFHLHENKWANSAQLSNRDKYVAQLNLIIAICTKIHFFFALFIIKVVLGKCFNFKIFVFVEMCWWMSMKLYCKN